MTELDIQLLADAQTSGGLLAAVPEKDADGIVEQLLAAGAPCAAVIGRLQKGPVSITVGD